MKEVHLFKFLSALFLVGGTTIGGGMLALPVVTGYSGFFPSLVVMGVCCLFMTLSALMLVEVSLWMEEGAHVVTMTERLLGRFGKIVSWILYLFICYASNVAYTAAAGSQIALVFQKTFNIFISKEVSGGLFLFFFSSFIMMGSSLVGRVNTTLFIGMILAYLSLLGSGLSEIKLSFLELQNWSSSLMGLPFFLTSFSFQTMVPSLTPYLNRNRKALYGSIIGGTVLAFVIYALWQMLILGIIPVEGNFGLREALCTNVPATLYLSEHVGVGTLSKVAEFFSFFAITTSFLGITLGLFDFLSDGLKVSKNGLGKFFLGSLIVLPTLFFAVRYENAFIAALDISGGVGDSLLNGMIPVLMVWSGLYVVKYEGAKPFFGGKLLLMVTFIFFLFTLGVEMMIQTGCIHSHYDIIKISKN
jgi:tyrosine-specific transport protein